MPVKPFSTIAEAKSLQKVPWLKILFGRRSPREFFKFYFVFAFFWVPLIDLILAVALTHSFQSFWQTFFISALISEICMTFCYLFSEGISASIRLRRYLKDPNFTPRQSSRFSGIFIGFLLTPIGMYLGFKGAGFLAGYMQISWTPPSFSDYRVGIVYALFSLGLIYSFYLYAEIKLTKKKQQEEKQLLEQKTLRAQLSSLTAQMNPHLLFNALNSIASMIPENPAGAEGMVVELGELYHQVLQCSRQDSHTLKKELELCQTYLNVEKVRFAERLNWKIETAEDVNSDSIEIPVLLVQPFLENAVKHGISSLAEGGDIFVTVTAENGTANIVIQDTGIGLARSPAKNGAGVAVQNCRERLLLRYGESAALNVVAPPEGGTRIEIRVPITESCFQ